MFKQFLTIAALATSVSSHMQLFYPPPLKGYNNPHTVVPDNELLYPYNCCGKTTPLICRGHLSLLGTPEGASVADWQAGSTQKWSLVGPAPLGGNHYGGSSQIGFSIDKGKTFRTVVSYEGSAPNRHGGEDPAGQTWQFGVPSDLPNGEAIFAWTWSNREQEFFMGCSVVTITGSSGSTGSTGSSAGTLATGSASASASEASRDIPYPVLDTSPTESEKSAFASSAVSPAASSVVASTCRTRSGRRCRTTKRDHPLLDVAMKYKRGPGEKAHQFVQRAANIAFSSRPIMLFVNVNNGCSSPKTTAELKYPNPGPDVVRGDGEYPLQLPSGICS